MVYTPDTGRASVRKSWTTTADRAARTAKARAAFQAKFTARAAEALGPDATDAEIAAAAADLVREHYSNMGRSRSS